MSITVISIPVWIVTRKLDGWHVTDFETREDLSGPYDKHGDAVEAADVRAYRVGKGWEP